LQAVLLVTSNNRLARKFPLLLPRGHKIVVASSKPTASFKGESFVFVDIDSVGTEQIRKYAGKTWKDYKCYSEELRTTGITTTSA